MRKAGRGRSSAGLVVFRLRERQPEVLLVHPGGPFWARKDLGAWSIPKGEIEAGEADELAAARREVEEETGATFAGPFVPLAPVVQPGGKTVVAFVVEGDCDTSHIRSNTFRMEWPPRSGKTAEFPEVDRAAFFDLPEARRRILPGQLPILDQLAEYLARERGIGGG